jgi:hypothetical protein
MPLKAFVAALGLFLAHNLVWLVTNQVRRPCTQKLCASPRDLEKVAGRSTHPRIATSTTLLYFLAQRIPHGTPLRLPPWMAPHQLLFAQVARLAPYLADHPYTISAAQAEGFRRGARAERAWQRRGGSRPIVQPVIVVLDEGATEYVLAELEGQAYGPLFLVPRAALEATP